MTPLIKSMPSGQQSHSGLRTARKAETNLSLQARTGQ